ncbi:MAG: ferric reductase-like transmembrane domain-containing protein [Anaerolineae bacterium]
MTKSTRIADIVSIIISLIVIVLAVVGTAQSGLFERVLSDDVKLSWHLVRSTGISAYLLMVGSMIWGLLMSTQFVKNWSPGPLSMTVHSTLSWLAVVLAFTHALLLLWDTYFSYSLTDLFVPFTGPYRPEAVGLGTLAFWISLLITISFSVKKRIGNRAWKWIHMLSYVGFVMVTLHGLFAGTDGQQRGFQIMIAVSVCIVVLMLGMRLGKDHAGAKPERPVARSARPAAREPGS